MHLLHMPGDVSPMVHHLLLMCLSLAWCRMKRTMTPGYKSIGASWAWHDSQGAHPVPHSSARQGAASL